MMRSTVRSDRSVSGRIGSFLLLMGLAVTMLFPSAVFAESTNTVLDAKEMEKYETESKYTVRVFSGKQGTFSTGEEFDYTPVSYGGTVKGEPTVTLPKDSKYFAKGFREGGKDSSYTGLVPIGELQDAINGSKDEYGTAGVTKDVDYVVAYGMKKSAMPYTVSYVDENQNLLTITENGVTLPNPMTYYGVSGDTVIVAAKQIDNWDVIYPARRQEIELGSSKSTDAVFVYRQRAAATPTPTATPRATTAPSSGGGGGTSSYTTTTTTTGGSTGTTTARTPTTTPAAGTAGTAGTGTTGTGAASGVSGTTGASATAGLGTGTTATTSGTQTGTGGQNAAVDSAIRNAVQGAAGRGAANLEPLPDTVNIDNPDVPLADFPGNSSSKSSSSESSSSSSSSSSSKSSSSDSKSSSSKSKSSSSSSSIASSSSSSSSSSSTSATETPTPEPTPAAGGISTTAKIGIGAGIGVVLGAVIGGLMMRRRRDYEDDEDDEDDDE